MGERVNPLSSFIHVDVFFLRLGLICNLNAFIDVINRLWRDARALAPPMFIVTFLLKYVRYKPCHDKCRNVGLFTYGAAIKQIDVTFLRLFTLMHPM